MIKIIIQKLKIILTKEPTVH